MPQVKVIAQRGFNVCYRGHNLMQDSLIRLKDIEIEAIKAAFRESFLAADNLWIFGSRVNLKARGGDIDLYVETTLKAELAVKARLKFVRLICEKIGEQKIDLVLRLLKDEVKLDIYDIARKEGVKLI